MKKIWMSILVACTLLGASTAYAKDQEVYLYVDGMALDVLAINRDGTSFVPFRALFERIGLSVSFDAAQNRVSGEKEGLQISFVIGSKSAVVNGKSHALQIAPFIKNGTTYIPVRFVGEQTGNAVYWTQQENLIQINTPTFKGVSYDLNGIPVKFYSDGTVQFGASVLRDRKVSQELALIEAINKMNEVENYYPGYPTAEEKLLPGYRGVPDYHEPHHNSDNLKKFGSYPPLMSEGWISFRMLDLIDNVTLIPVNDPTTVVIAWDFSERYELKLTEEYRAATTGEFVLNDIRVQKYNGSMFLNIEDLRKHGILSENPEDVRTFE